MTISNIFFRAAVLALIVGISLGVWMGHEQNFTLKSLHAHINLLGWVSMFLFGAFYRLFPEAARGWPAKVHVALFIPGFVLMVSGLAGLMLQKMALLPALLAGEALAFLAVLVFAFILFRATGRRATTA